MSSFLLNWPSDRIDCISRLAEKLSEEEYQAIKLKFDPKTYVSKECQTDENKCIEVCSK